VSKWGNVGDRPKCCGVVPTLFVGPFLTDIIDVVLSSLDITGSIASPGFMRPEGIVIYHKAAGCLFKKTIENDELPKGVLPCDK